MPYTIPSTRYYEIPIGIMIHCHDPHLLSQWLFLSYTKGRRCLFDCELGQSSDLQSNRHSPPCKIHRMYTVCTVDILQGRVSIHTHLPARYVIHVQCVSYREGCYRVTYLVICIERFDQPQFFSCCPRLHQQSTHARTTRESSRVYQDYISESLSYTYTRRICYVPCVD